MAILFNSITQFVQQPERTKRRVKRDDLDTLTEVWVGPSYAEDYFVPRIGAAHPEANLMTVIDTSIKRMAAGVAEVTINYHGKLDNSGTHGYTSVPEISQSWMEGEVSYSQGGFTYSRRYTGRCCQISYITNRRPTGNPTNIGLSKEFLGFTNVWEMVTGFTPGGGSGGTGTPISKLTCTDVKIEDKADGWYRVSETYQSRQFPGNYTGGDPGGTIIVKTTLNDQALTSADASGRTTGAAQAATNLYGKPLTTSTPGTNEYDTYLMTAIDPTWRNSDVPAQVQSAAAAWGDHITPDMAITSVSQNYAPPAPNPDPQAVPLSY